MRANPTPRAPPAAAEHKSTAAAEVESMLHSLEERWTHQVPVYIHRLKTDCAYNLSSFFGGQLSDALSSWTAAGANHLVAPASVTAAREVVLQQLGRDRSEKVLKDLKVCRRGW